MTNGITRSVLMIALLTLPFSTFAQSTESGGPGILLISIFLIAAFLLLLVVLQVAESLIHIEASKLGIDTKKHNFSILPTGADFSRKAATDGRSVKVLKQGYDIKLAGKAETILDIGNAKTFALQPANFVGMSPIPKVLVEPGDEVQAGDPIFFDKKRPDLMYCSPVSGEVVDVRRGEKRAVKEIVILADKSEMKFKAIAVPSLNADRTELVSFLMANGAWPLIVQRPYDVVPDADIVPRNIFISTFDSAPLAPDNNFVVQGQEAHFQKGLDVLVKLTSGKVHLGLNAAVTPAAAFSDAIGVEKHWFKGPHPAGNVGIQIHHIDPINTIEKVWTVSVQACIQVGKLFNEGRFDASRIVALTGATLAEPKYVKTYQGACVGELLQNNMKSASDRIVAGDVLSGKQKTAGDFLNFHDDQITVLIEGNKHEMFGWLLPTTARPSISKTYPTNAIFSDMEFEANTNTHGEKRAFVVTGEYEKVLPLNIYPQHLMKAIIVNDFEQMEGLGICELSEEDIALCEFVCTSKQPLQAILREGLDTMRLQG